MIGRLFSLSKGAMAEEGLSNKEYLYLSDN